MKSSFDYRTFSKEQARKSANLLPLYIRENVEQEEADWKHQIFTNLPKSIEQDLPEQIDFWIGCLDVYIHSKVFSLTNEEYGSILQILFNFITMSSHWNHVVAACRCFFFIHRRSRQTEIHLVLPWRPLYSLIQRIAFSRSKICQLQAPSNLLNYLVSLIRGICNLFPETATKEMLDLWSPTLDPHYSNFVQSHTLLCLFLPPAQAIQWFSKFMSIWPMYKGGPWDYQWLVLFSRVSKYRIEGVDWEPHLPFLFNLLSIYLELPQSPLDYDIPPINDYPSESFSQFFIDYSSDEDLFPYFTFIFVNLLSQSCKQTVRTMLEKLFFMLTPSFSPAQNQSDSGINFMNALIGHYLKRVQEESDYGPLYLPLLTQEDHEWFVKSVLPMVIMDRFLEDPRIAQLKGLIGLLPKVVIPKILDTVVQCLTYERLEQSALKALDSVIPLMVANDHSPLVLRDFLTKFATDLSYSDMPTAFRIFDIFSVISICFPRDETFEESIYTVIEKLLYFIENMPETDYQTTRDVTNNVLVSILPNSSASLYSRAFEAFKSAFPKLPPHGIADLAAAFGEKTISTFSEQASNPSSVKDFAILIGVSKITSNFVRDHIATITKAIIKGCESQTKEIRQLAVRALKRIPMSLLETLLLPLENQSGLLKTNDVILNWKCPSEADVTAALYFIDEIYAHFTTQFQSADTAIKAKAIKFLAAVSKGMRPAVTNTNFTVVVDEYGLTQPKLSRFSSQEVSKRWGKILSFLSDTIAASSPDKVLCASLKSLSMFTIPRDSVGVNFAQQQQKLRLLKDFLRIPFSKGIDFAPVIYQRAKYIYAFRHGVFFTPFTKEIESVIRNVMNICDHPNEKVRSRAALFVQEVSAAYPDQFGPFFIPVIEKAKVAISPTSLCGYYSVLCSTCQLVFNEANFQIIGDAALSSCRDMPPDLPDDSPRSLRQLMRMTYELTGLSEIRYLSDPFILIRRKLALNAIEKARSTTDKEVTSFAAAFVIQMTLGCPKIIEPQIFEFLTSQLTNDEPTIREVIISTLPSMIELLQPRTPRKLRHKYPKVDETNYDDAIFEDRIIPGLSKTEILILNNEQLSDEKLLSQFFSNAEDRVKIHAFLVDTFLNKDDLISSICRVLMDELIHQEETYARIHVSFWASLIRHLGVKFALKLMEFVEKMSGKDQIKSKQVIAAELFSSVLCSFKHFPFTEISKVIPAVLAFIGRIIAECEPEFQDVWYVAIVCGIANLDPNRFFWLFKHLLSLIPTPITQIREAKTTSFIMDVLFEFAWRVEGLPLLLAKKGIEALFSEFSQGFEQIRDCSIRAISSFFSCMFSMGEDGVNSEVHRIFEKDILAVGDSFLVPWLNAQFSTQTMSGFIINRLAIDHIKDWLKIALGKNEDEERQASVCLLRMIRSNWLWPCAQHPSSIENAAPIIHKIIDQLDTEGQPWQVQTVIVFLLSGFVGMNFFYLKDEDLDMILKKLVFPLMSYHNYDVQDSASEVYTDLLKSSPHLRNAIPESFIMFRRWLFTGETAHEKIAGAKGIISIVMSTLIFDSVPSYLCECLEVLTDAQANDQAVEPTISQALAEFWSIHEANLTAEVAEALAPYRETMRPGYFC